MNHFDVVNKIASEKLNSDPFSYYVLYYGSCIQVNMKYLTSKQKRAYMVTHKEGEKGSAARPISHFGHSNC
jgi:hypothetical protein